MHLRWKKNKNKLKVSFRLQRSEENAQNWLHTLNIHSISLISWQLSLINSLKNIIISYSKDLVAVRWIVRKHLFWINQLFVYLSESQFTMPAYLWAWRGEKHYIVRVNRFNSIIINNQLICSNSPFPIAHSYVYSIVHSIWIICGYTFKMTFKVVNAWRWYEKQTKLLILHYVSDHFVFFYNYLQ